MTRLLQIGVDHPHGPLYRETIAHHDGFELSGGYDPDPKRAARLLALEGVEMPLFDDIEAAIAATAPDAVLVTLPNDVTPDAIAFSARTGLHIFAEKPCAVSANAFQPALDAIREHDVSFVAAYLRRFSPVAMAMRDMIAEGLLGDLISAQVTFATTNVKLRNDSYLDGKTIEEVSLAGAVNGGASAPGEVHWLFDRARSGGGIMHWLGVHWLDLLRMVTGHEFTRASASLATRTSVPVQIEDVASVTLDNDTGLIATLACGYVNPRGPDQTGIAIHGTRGWITWDGSSPRFEMESDHPSWASDRRRTVAFEIPARPGYSGAVGWDAFSQFKAAFEQGAPLPTGPDDAMATLQLLDAIQQSHREGRRIEVPAPDTT